jgi:hypothetical protein
MSKKNRNKNLTSENAGHSQYAGFAQNSGISKRGWRIIGIGVLVAILGYVVLSFTDPMGENFASHLSPLLIIGGYGIIGYGIIARDS